MTTWQPSERMRRLAERKGVDLDHQLPRSQTKAEPLIEALKRMAKRGGLYKRAASAVLRAAGYSSHTFRLQTEWPERLEKTARFREKYPTAQAFAGGLRQPDVDIMLIRNLGKRGIAALRQEFGVDNEPSH